MRRGQGAGGRQGAGQERRSGRAGGADTGAGAGPIGNQRKHSPQCQPAWAPAGGSLAWPHLRLGELLGQACRLDLLLQLAAHGLVRKGLRVVLKLGCAARRHRQRGRRQVGGRRGGQRAARRGGGVSAEIRAARV
jgi:hypothetical protein